MRMGKFHGMAHHAQRLLEVVGDRLLVDHRDRPLLGPQASGEVAEVVDGQREVGGQRLPDRLPVLPALGDGEHLEVFLHPVGDPVEDVGPLGRAGRAPGDGSGVGGVEGQLDIAGVGPGDLAELLARAGGDVGEVPAGGRSDPLAPDEVVVPGLEGDDGAVLAWWCVAHAVFPLGNGDVTGHRSRKECAPGRVGER
jgi:hypothetical protein